MVSPIKSEIEHLRISRTADDQRLGSAERNFWKAGGVCCPGCGVPGFSKLVNKQERRMSRHADLAFKLLMSLPLVDLSEKQRDLIIDHLKGRWQRLQNEQLWVGVAWADAAKQRGELQFQINRIENKLKKFLRRIDV